MKEGLDKFIKSEDFTGDLTLVNELCGFSTAVALATNFKGCYLYIPQNCLNNARLRLAQELIEKGMSLKRVALKLDLNERTLQRFTRQKRSTEATGDLFEDLNNDPNPKATEAPDRP